VRHTPFLARVWGIEKAALERRFLENARASSSRSEMARTRQLVAPKGTGALLSCALSPHDGGASLAVGGENAAALVFDLRGAHLVAHRLTAASGCFDRQDAVPCVAYNLAAPHALYCASGRTVTAWDLRRLPGATDARGARYGGDGATKSAPPTSDRCHRAPDDDGEFANANDDALSTEKKTNDRGAIDVYAHNSDEINHFVIDRKGAFMYAADDNCEVAVVNVDCGKAGGVKTKTLRNDGHENFVSCVALRGHKPREVVSGGLDARVCVWDRDRSAPVKRWSVSELIDAFDARVAEDADANVGEHPSPMMNPPFVHCVATWACERDPAHLDTKRLAAAACGDGTVALVDLDFEAKKRDGKEKKSDSYVWRARRELVRPVRPRRLPRARRARRRARVRDVARLVSWVGRRRVRGVGGERSRDQTLATARRRRRIFFTRARRSRRERRERYPRAREKGELDGARVFARGVSRGRARVRGGHLGDDKRVRCERVRVRGGVLERNALFCWEEKRLVRNAKKSAALFLYSTRKNLRCVKPGQPGMRAKKQTTGHRSRASDARSSRRAPWLRTRLSARPSGASSARARRAALPPRRPCARRSFPRGAARPGARAASWRWTDLARAGWAATTARWTRTCFTSA
jgi:hypothetical protein